MVVTASSAAAAQAVVGTGPAGGDAYRFAAKIQIGADPGRGCSGALVAPQWIITAKACFAAGAQAVVTGPPAEPTTVIVGRPDLTSSTGRRLPVNRLVPHPDRDVVLARLAAPVTDVPPVAVATTAPQTGEQWRVLGFGRTATEWVPQALHEAVVSVETVGAVSADIAGVDPAGATTCKGDAGGPALRGSGTAAELVAVHLSSGQQGCLGATGTAPGAVEARVDDLAGWIAGTAITSCNVAGGVITGNHSADGIPLPDLTGDCSADIIKQYTSGEMQGWRGSGNVTVDGRLFTGTSKIVGGGWTVAAVPRIVLGDFNGDGRTDIVRQNPAGELRAWPSTGDMSADNLLFRTSVIVGSGWTTANVQRILTGDFDGDGRTDIAAQYADGGVRAWSSTGNLSADGKLFAGPRSLNALGLTVAAYPRLLTADVDGDGRYEILAQAKDGKVYAYPSSGDLSADGKLFAAPRRHVGTGWTQAAIPRILTGDFDGDGRGDIAAQYTDGRLRAWSSTGDLSADAKLFTGRYTTHTYALTVADHPRLLTGDVNHDGRTDIVAQAKDGRLLAYPSSGNHAGDNTLFPLPARLVGSGWHLASYPRIF